MTTCDIREKRVLVAGGAGFIGSHLVDALVRHGASRVVAVDNLFLGRRENLNDAIAVSGAVTLYEQDASDLEAMRRIISEERIEVVFNLAVIPLPTSLERPKFTVDTNVQISTSLCELARQGAYQTLVEFSSSEAYGTAETVPMSEEHPLRPCTPYAASKAASDFVVSSYIETFGIDAAILRPFNNFAPRQNDAAYAGVIPIVINRVRRGEPIEIFGDGEQTRDFIYAPDTAKAAIELYQSPDTRGVVVNVGSGRETSVNQLVTEILEIMGVPNHPVVHVDERPGDVRRHCADISRARETFDFEPKTTLVEGLRRTVEWYRGKNRQ